MAALLPGTAWVRALVGAGLALAAGGCSSIATVQTDRTRDLAAIQTRAPAERAPLLRDRVLRDGLTARLPTIAQFAPLMQFPLYADIAATAPVAIADDYLALGDALRAARDLDGALAAYEAALAMSGRLGPDEATAARVRVTALRGQAAAWGDLGDADRARAATVLGDLNERRPPPGDREALLLDAVVAGPGAVFRRMARAPVLAGMSPSGVAAFARSPLGVPAAMAVFRTLELLRSGAPLGRVEREADVLATLAPSLGPSLAPAVAPPLAAPPPPAASAPVAPPQAPPPAAPAGDLAARLQKLDDLRARKLINETEYARERARILREGL